ncbi:MAG: DsrE family protein, partial [Candidatus Hodarchaeota archaeon]
TCGRDDLERATTAWVVANAALTLVDEVALFIQANGVDCVRKDFIDGFQWPPFDSVKNLVNSFIKGGGKIYVCEPCIKSRKLEPSDLIDDATVTGAATLLTLATKSTTLTY